MWRETSQLYYLKFFPSVTEQRLMLISLKSRFQISLAIQNGQ